LPEIGIARIVVVALCVQHRKSGNNCSLLGGFMPAFSALGFIGLGVMGSGMCSNLVRKSGLPVHGTDLSTQAVAALVAEGMLSATTVEDLATQAECVFLSLPGGPQVEAVVDRILAAQGAVRMVVDMSTAPATLARDLSARCAKQGIAFVDAPVARLRQAAKDGTLSIMVGATPEQFADVHPLLAHMGSDITHCGSSGAGQVAKILNNMVVFMNVQAMAEALAIGRAQGVDGKTLFEVLSLGSADSFMLRNTGMNNLVPDHFPTETFPVDYALKDLGYALDLARDAGIAPPGALTTQKLLEETRAAGFAREYYPIFIRLIDGTIDKVE
jgi:3-hydroxyisobutyrate dehydrogenase-like beta-hydroxyacid dehydrogenase